MKYILPFFFFFNLLHCQTADLDSLFTQFNSYRYDDVKASLIKIDKSKLPRQTRTDSIRFSLFNLVTAKFDKNNQTTEEFFSKNLDYLIKIGLQDYLPYFLTAYAFEFGYRKHLYQKVKDYLDLSVTVSKENKNLSHYLSKVNLFNAYFVRDIIRAASDESYKKEDLYEAIKIYEENSNLIAITDTNLFKSYYKIAFSKDFSEDIRFHCLKKTFDYSINLKTLPDLYDLRDLLYQFRSEDSANNEIDFINENYFRKTTKYRHLSILDFLINECYIQDFSNFSVTNLINHSNLLMKSEHIFDDSSIRDIYLVTTKSALSFNNFILKEDKNESLDESFFESLFNFQYEFFKKYGNLSSQKSILSDLITFYENSDSYMDSDVDLVKLDFELSEIIYSLIVDKESNNVTPYNVINMIKSRLTSGIYTGMSEDEVDEEMIKIFEKYKKSSTYESAVTALTLFWELELSIKSMINEEFQFKFNETREFILSNLNDSYNLEDIGLRIRISTNENIDSKKLIVDKLFNEKLIDRNEFNVLYLSIMGTKFDLEPSKKNAEAYCNFFLQNIETPDFKFSIGTVLDLYIAYQFKNGLVKISNYLLEQYDKYFANEVDQNKYEFQKSAGYFFKYIRNYKRALNFFLDARANNYHWVNRGFSYLDLISDNVLLFEIFDLNLRFDLKQSRLSLESYINRYRELENMLSEAIKNSPTMDEDTFIGLKRQMLDMQRRQLFYENNHEESEKIIDKMLVMEKETPYWGEFELMKTKFSSQFSQNKYTNVELLSKLEYMYQKYNKPQDEFYNKWKTALSGVVTKEFVDNRIAEFNEAILDIEIMNDLSYESQIKFMTKAANDLYYLERDIYENIFNTDQLIKLANFKFLLDNVDVYNTRILSLNDRETNTYFDLLNKRFTETNYETLNAIITQFDVFQQRIKVNSSDISTLTNISDFQQKLGSNQAYIRFSSVAFDKYIAYIITKDKIELVKLEQSKIDKLVGYYTNRIKNKLEDSYSYDVFFKPIADKLPSDINEIFIKNYGLLSNVNFEALRNPTTNRFVFEDYKINYVERPESALSMDNSISISSAFLFGNPDFTYNLEETGSVSSIRSGLNPLPFTEVEINKLNDVLTKNGISTVTTNLYESTEQALYENSKSDIIHLATHGFYIDGESTDRFNWGLLASGSKEVIQNDFKKIRREDGIIFGSEIILKNFTKAKLVVLSACETGYGTKTFFGGENLANSFLRAGAKNIISTLWPVDDEITQLFMTEFYTDLLKTKNINLSLRNTKLKIKQNYPEPLYWAPFVLTQNYIK